MGSSSPVGSFKWFDFYFLSILQFYLCSWKCIGKIFSNFRIADFSFYDRVNAGTRLYFLLSETFLSSLNHKSFGRETTV